MAKHANYCDMNAEEMIDRMSSEFQEAISLLDLSQANLVAALNNLDKLVGVDTKPKQFSSVAPEKEEGDGARPENERA